MWMALEIVKAIISWPMVALIALLLFRRRLALLLDRLIRSEGGKAKVGPVEIDMGKAVEIAERIVGKSPAPRPEELPRPTYLALGEADGSVALVGLRIEIEKRLRGLCAQHNLPEKPSITGLFRSLRTADVLDDELFHGLEWISTAGNRAAHGAAVDPEMSKWAVEYGPRILASLDELRDAPEQRRP